jgi:flagellar biosynthesis anti-sigma factor FlgM
MLDGISGVRPPGFDGPKESRDRNAPPTAAGPAGSDKVELSSAGLLLARLQALPDIREEKVEAIRQQILHGTYVTEEKVGKAMDSLVEDFLQGM